jgi:WD40 repeat protein
MVTWTSSGSANKKPPFGAQEVNLSITMKQTKPLNLRGSYKAQFSRTGSLLVTLSRDIVVWDVERRAKHYRVHPFAHPSDCSIHPDETRIVVKNTAGKIALLDAQDGALICFLDSVKGNEGSNILYSSCGEYVVDGSWGGHLTVRSATSGSVVFQKTFPGEMITKIAHSSHNDTWFVVHQPTAISDDQSPAPAYISVWGWPMDAPVDFLKSSENCINAISVSPDGRHLCVVGHASIAVMNLAEKRFVGSVPYNFGGTGFVTNWSPDSREIASVQRNSCVFHDASTMEKLKSIELQYASDIAYSPDGNLLALGSWEAGMLITRDATPHVG